MSRYSAKIEGNKELAWGWDNPLQEYFIELFDADDEHEFALGTNVCLVPHPSAPDKVNYSRGDIADVFQQYADYIPDSHLKALALDVPF